MQAEARVRRLNETLICAGGIVGQRREENRVTLGSVSLRKFPQSCVVVEYRRCSDETTAFPMRSTVNCHPLRSIHPAIHCNGVLLLLLLSLIGRPSFLSPHLTRRAASSSTLSGPVWYSSRVLFSYGYRCGQRHLTSVSISRAASG